MRSGRGAVVAGFGDRRGANRGHASGDGHRNDSGETRSGGSAGGPYRYTRGLRTSRARGRCRWRLGHLGRNGRRLGGGCRRRALCEERRGGGERRQQYGVLQLMDHLTPLVYYWLTPPNAK